jgi:hypothetical protein
MDPGSRQSVPAVSRTDDPRGHFGPVLYEASSATWRSGYAAACKAVYTGSIPVVASRRITSKEADCSTNTKPNLVVSAIRLPKGSPCEEPIER